MTGLGGAPTNSEECRVQGIDQTIGHRRAAAWAGAWLLDRPAGKPA